ncbi:type IV secretory system conjugative DNA transfer family protein [Hymenobacter fodinae]|uniref:Type IV secretory system conjugative DNA transfer family protein n=1 Tax=Hymenobacter fodinae TaxID=2510796 RepID=A0A4Z0P0R1_9BACT|nr:type IV secretory system conjugative DNA transfer family protein [Hymenobacter fodinae]TGE04613.1 type IV secretory system conjugative DNA transfer family protein [Hymenobacter fodinae]
MKPLNITEQDVRTLLTNQPNPSLLPKVILFIVGLILTPLTMAGALWGYIRGYMRFLAPQGKYPDLAEFPNIVKLGMVIFAALAWVLVVGIGWTAFHVFEFFFEDFVEKTLAIQFFVFNAIFSVIVFAAFTIWQKRFIRTITEMTRHGSGRLGGVDDLADFINTHGVYIGGIMSYPRMGHILTVGSTRSGKGTSLIIPALLDATPYEGSWVVIDPKGENAAITARHQRKKGQKVLMLDPWGVQTNMPATLNPMDLLKPGDHLIDDVMMLAEMIVPESASKSEPYWDNRARSIIAGLLLHIYHEKGAITYLWQALRLNSKEFASLINEMQYSQDEVVRATGRELESLAKSEKTFTSIMSHALDHTDFLKSPAMQRSLSKSSFNMDDLTDGKTTLYVILPADKLKSHSQWLRLVVTTCMRTSVRNHKERVTFLLDEFASLGTLKEVSEFGLAAAAGYNISLWMILQSLPQLQNLYEDNWQNFIANTSVRQYVGVSDNFTAEYVSKSMGQATIMTTDEKDRQTSYQTSARSVRTPDEVRYITDHNVILQIDRRPTTIMPKYPYFVNPALEGRHDPNPYHKAEKKEPAKQPSAPTGPTYKRRAV